MTRFPTLAPLAALPFAALFSVVAACGGSIASPSEQEINGQDPGGSSGSSGGSRGRSGGSSGTAQCTAAPSCDPGDTALLGKRACAPDARCYERSLCGQTIRCTGETAQCAAYPSCPNGYLEVPSSSCTANGCVTATLCGATIFCAPDTRCDGYPQCDPGHTAVKSPAQCLQDDAVCYPRSTCGVTIWCTGWSAADAGARPPGEGQP